MTKEQKKIKRIVFRYFNNIYQTSVRSTNGYAPGMVNISVLKVIIDKTKLGKNADIPATFKSSFNNTLDVLYEICKKNSTDAGMIPSVLLKSYIKIIKGSFTNGLKS